MTTEHPTAELSLLSIDQARARLGDCGRTLIFAKIKSGELRAVKLGHRTRIVRKSLDDFIAKLPEARSRAAVA